MFANGSGSCSTGVRSLSGWVRSTTRTSPEASARDEIGEQGMRLISVAAEGLLEPFGADVGVDLRVEHQRAVAVREPVAHAVEVLDAAASSPRQPAASASAAKSVSGNWARSTAWPIGRKWCTSAPYAASS